MKKKIVVIGGGFGGLYFAKKIKSADFEITLIDRRNHHLFQPLLYQVATGGLSPGDIAYPIRSALSSKKNMFSAFLTRISRENLLSNDSEILIEKSN